MKFLGLPITAAVFMIIFGQMTKIVAGLQPCENGDGQIGFCVDVENQTPAQIDAQCPVATHDLDLDYDEECPNDTDVLNHNICTNTV